MMKKKRILNSQEQQVIVNQSGVMATENNTDKDVQKKTKKPVAAKKKINE